MAEEAVKERRLTIGAQDDILPHGCADLYRRLHASRADGKFGAAPGER